MSMVGYKNESFYDGVTEKLLVEASINPKCKQALVGLLHNFYLQKRYNAVSQAAYQLVREQWRMLECRVEEWLELVVALANLVSSTEADCKSFILELLSEKIWPHRKYLSVEQLASCLASVAMVLVEPTNPPQLKEMAEELFRLIPRDRPYRIELKLLLRLSAECLSVSLGCSLDIPESVKSLAQL